MAAQRGAKVKLIRTVSNGLLSNCRDISRRVAQRPVLGWTLLSATINILCQGQRMFTTFAAIQIWLQALRIAGFEFKVVLTDSQESVRLNSYV